jgi:hypothetical protein
MCMPEECLYFTEFRKWFSAFLKSSIMFAPLCVHGSTEALCEGRFSFSMFIINLFTREDVM